MRRTYSGFFQPTFVVDYSTLVRGYGVQILWERLDESYRAGAVQVKLTANAAQGATSIAVVALTENVSQGRVVRFGAGKFAQVAVKALKGATTITVVALDAALVSGDAGWTGGGVKQLLAGTVLCKANGSNKYIPRALKGGSDGEATCILYTNAEEGDDGNGWTNNDGYTGYGQLVGGVVWENLLPEAVGGVITTAWKTELKANGTGWRFETSADSRAV